MQHQCVRFSPHEERWVAFTSGYINELKNVPTVNHFISNHTMDKKDESWRREIKLDNWVGVVF